MLVNSLREGTLPLTMSEAVIVVVPKPGKDLEYCASYHTISLLNVDAKLLTKILARGLNMVITALVHMDQSGFMLGRGTDINIRLLFTHTPISTEDSLGVVASLDAEKVFDSVKWEFLWKVLECFGFGPKFIGWLKLSYRSPVAGSGKWGSLPFLYLGEQGRDARFPQGCSPWQLSPWQFFFIKTPE